jgi:threonine dehydratase
MPEGARPISCKDATATDWPWVPVDAATPAVWSQSHHRAEGLATRMPFDLPQQILRKLLDDFILVSDDSISDAVHFLLARNRTLVEGAGAAAVAAAFALKERLAGKRVALILSGGNISVPQLKTILARD